jgi:hypothetical protein
MTADHGRRLLLALALALAATVGWAQVPAAPEEEAAGEAWSYSASVYGYFIPRDLYGQPTVTADRGWFHTEARYNYEARDTASVWLGYNFSVGEKLTLEFTPLFGGVIGEIDGIAPGYKLSVGFWKLELYSEGEYVVDVNDSTSNFFYTWNELTVSPWDCLRLGLVAQRTRAYQTELDIQRGLLVGVSAEHWDFTVFVFNPDQGDPFVVVALALTF